LKIIVGSGKDKTEFFIPKDLICSHSGFFKAACNPQWECGRTNTITLEEDDPKIFGIFLTWISTKDLEQAEDLVEVVEKVEGNEAEWDECYRKRYNELLGCYILGDVFQSPNFQNAVMGSIVSDLKIYYFGCARLLGSNRSSLIRVFQSTPKTSPLRKMFLEVLITTYEIDTYVANFAPEQSTKMLAELLALSMKANRDTEIRDTIMRVPWVKDRCYYHLHPGQPDGYSCTNKFK